ncbi:hypothetical protein EPICR_170052 [Candidatus Desulfarcum epimagneticum]|uniref:Uncharacterized protein n=1 Tax=uncultured Desulfobacteraceae bacterium TaxID=218296 RepID=A0A484HDT1_9BACT|nr:hypothetical protein EPICR_170052 [uncultured Desulfobacteraceae bacterium]
MNPRAVTRRKKAPLAADLLRMPVTRDIVIADFGRDASLEYLRLVSRREKRLIEGVLAPEGHAFFDEYRRVMHTVVGDLAFLKETALERSAKNPGYLKGDILIGTGPWPRPGVFFQKLARLAVQQALLAMDRGPGRVRVVIPCNTLSDEAKRLDHALGSARELRKRLGPRFLSRSRARKIAAAGIRAFAPPEAVIRRLAENGSPGKPLNLLVLGARGARAVYEKLAAFRGLHVTPLENRHDDLIRQTIVASIGNRRERLDLCRRRLIHEIIEPRKKRLGSLVVLEARTDFRLGLGPSSLEIFADAMTSDAYGGMGADAAMPSLHV